MLHTMALHGAESLETSFETDRARFIGRGNSVASPAAFADTAPLSGTQGPVLDPIVAIRHRFVLDPEEDLLVRRIAGLVYVTDRDRVLARQRVLARRDTRLRAVSPTQRQQIAAVATDLDHRPSSRNANGMVEAARRVAMELTARPAGIVDAGGSAVVMAWPRQARATASAKRSLVLSRTSSVSNLRRSPLASSCAALASSI